MHDFPDAPRILEYYEGRLHFAKEKLAYDYSHERPACPRRSFSHRNVDTRSAANTSRFLPCHSDIRPLSAMMPRSLIIIRVAREHGARNSVYTHLASAVYVRTKGARDGKRGRKRGSRGECAEEAEEEEEDDDEEEKAEEKEGEKEECTKGGGLRRG